MNYTDSAKKRGKILICIYARSLLMATKSVAGLQFAKEDLPNISGATLIVAV